MTHRKRDTPQPGESLAQRAGDVTSQSAPAEKQAAALRAQAQHLEQMQQLHVTAWAGQFPHPDDLRVYEEYCPGFLQQLMRERSEQMSHRHRLESMVTVSNIENSRRAQWLGLVVVLAALIVCVIVAISGYPLFGLGGAIGAIAVLAGVFVYTNDQRMKELREKWRELTSSQAAQENSQLPVAGQEESGNP